MLRASSCISILSLVSRTSTWRPIHRDRVAVTVKGYIAFDIHGPLLQTINLRDPHGQRFQMPLLEGEQLARNGADMFFVGGVHAIAPLPCLFIQVWPAGERTAG